MAKEGLALQTIKTYLAATRNTHISLGFPDPREHSSLPILHRIQLGIKRIQALKGTHQRRVRLPITAAILDSLRSHWEATKHPDRLVLWAAASLCFAGFFRLGELLPTSNSHPTQRGVAWGDIAVDNVTTPSTLRIHLQFSKCDQFGKGADVFVGKADNRRCPVVAVVAYMVARGSKPGKFFLLQSGKPLYKPGFITHMRKALTAIGLDQASFAGHSFRIGAATAAAQAGLPDSTIQILGRWSSAAFLSYIHTPRQQLAALTAKIM